MKRESNGAKQQGNFRTGTTLALLPEKKTNIMKKIAIIAIALIAGSTVMAQQGSTTTTPRLERQPEIQKRSAEDRAKMRTERMTQNLNLTEEQQKRVYNIVLEQAKTHDAQREQRQERREALREQRDETDARIREVLTDEQQERFDAMQKQRTERMEQRQERRGEMRQKPATRGEHMEQRRSRGEQAPQRRGDSAPVR